MVKLLAILSFIALAALPFASAQSIENATIEREEYAVYSAMIIDYVDEERGVMVIANPTVRRDEPWTVKTLEFYSTDLKTYITAANAPVVAQETLDDFLRRNKSNRWLTPKFEIDRKYVLVDYREITKLASDMGHPNTAPEEWKPFFKEYPESHGFISLSRVGFNQQMDQALVHVGWRCPSLCGHWSFLLLAKKDGVWKVVGESNRIVS